MREGKFKCNSYYGCDLYSECLPLEGRWTVMFINHKDTDEDGNRFGIKVRDSYGEEDFIYYDVKSRLVYNSKSYNYTA